MGGSLQREEDVTAPGGLVAGAVECQVLGAKANLCRETSFGKSSVLRYQQGLTLTKRHQRRLRQQLYEREKTMEGCQRLPDLFRTAAARTRGPVTQQMPRNLQLTGKQSCPPAPHPLPTLPAPHPLQQYHRTQTQTSQQCCHRAQTQTPQQYHHRA